MNNYEIHPCATCSDTLTSLVISPISRTEKPKMAAINTLEFVYPDWPAPVHVKALTTTRNGGFSVGPYASFHLSNLAGDETRILRPNRSLLREVLNLPAEPQWQIGRASC